MAKATGNGKPVEELSLDQLRRERLRCRTLIRTAGELVAGEHLRQRLEQIDERLVMEFGLALEQEEYDQDRGERGCMSAGLGACGGMAATMIFGGLMYGLEMVPGGLCGSVPGALGGFVAGLAVGEY